MPGKYKRRTKSYGRRRFYRRGGGYKRKFIRRRRLRISTQRVKQRLISDRTSIKFTTHLAFRMTTDTTVGFAIEVLHGNDLSDPMGSESATAQPTGLDQWGHFYTRYFVAASKCVVEVQNLTAAVAPRFVLIPTANSPLNGANDWDASNFKPEEMPYSQHRMVNSSGGGRPLMMKGYMSTQKIAGRTKPASEDNYYGALPNNGTGATTPSRLWYWNLALLNRDLPATATTCVVFVKMTYYCKLIDRIDVLPTSTQ